MFRKVTFCCMFFALTLLVGSLQGAKAGDPTDYPLRAKHPKLSPIETPELASSYDKAIIIDSRNEVEFDVIHIEKAKNILVGKMKEEDLLALRPKDGAAPLVFYCNGVNCAKSYKAAEKATEMGFSNIRVYDPGIFAWTQQQPEKTKFFGEPLTADKAKTALISKDKFEAACLDTAAFIEKTKDEKFAIFDIRDPNERSEFTIKLPRIKSMPMDTFVDLLKKKSPAVPKENLLFIDNVGKQTDWLQYYLDKEGVKNYIFLKGGVAQWQKDGFNAEGGK